MSEFNYPLGHTAEESARLEQQAGQMKDSNLAVLARGATHCLEIGCGVGSNLAPLLVENPKLNYIGTDINAASPTQARNKYLMHGDHVDFRPMDAKKLEFSAETFDLVFSKLVLWSLGSDWQKAVAEAYRVLKVGGVFHTFEPDDGFLLFQPPKPNLQKVISLWQSKQTAGGFNPFVGREIYAALRSAGFTNIRVAVYHKVSTGERPEAYASHLENLQKIMLGQGPESLGLSSDDQTWKAALAECQDHSPESSIIETHFVVSGLKSGEQK